MVYYFVIFMINNDLRIDNYEIYNFLTLIFYVLLGIGLIFTC
ncbi:MAG: hypothetical protein JWR23_53 [Mucilaginibacter sp.]|nr:hypothetical protein [Mucilaginibacter sp.]